MFFIILLYEDIPRPDLDKFITESRYIPQRASGYPSVQQTEPMSKRLQKKRGRLLRPP